MSAACPEARAIPGAGCAAAQRPPNPPAGRRADHGLIALEWLLVVGAVAGLAASSVLIVQRVVDDTSEVPADPLVRLLQADVEAAFIASEANEAVVVSSPVYDDGDFRPRCVTDLLRAFDDVVSTSEWDPPTALGTPPELELGAAAKCRVTPKPGLGG